MKTNPLILISVIIPTLLIFTIQTTKAETNPTNQPPSNAITGTIIGAIVAAIGGIIVGLMKYYFDKRSQLQKQEYDLELKNMEHKYDLELNMEHKHNLDAQYDLDLRTRRIKAYKKLWSELSLLSYYSRPDNTTYQDLKDLQLKLTKWYYDTGGLFLTETSQKIYYMFVKELENRIDKNELTKAVSDLKDIRNFASRFRTNLCKDIGTRDEPKNPSMYGVLQIQTSKDKYQEGDRIIITVKNIGNNSLQIPDRILGVEIRNLFEYDSSIFLKQEVDVLNPKDERTFECNDTPLTAGNYIARTFGTITSMKDFQIEAKKSLT